MGYKVKKDEWNATEEASSNEEYPILPEGTYAVKVAKAEEKISKSGNSYFNIGLKVISGEYSGAYVWDTIMLNDNPKSTQRLKLFLKRIGLIEDELDADVEIEAEDFIGRVCTIDVIIKTERKGYETEEKNKVAFAGYGYYVESDDATDKDFDMWEE